MTPLQFTARTLGARVRAPGGLGGQCVDLANLWLQDAYGLAPVHRNAIDWATGTLPGFDWVANTPTNVPSAGCLVVWRDWPALRIGVYGHIAVVLEADVMSLLTVDQNWRAEIVTVELHAYSGVLGWRVRAA